MSLEEILNEKVSKKQIVAIAAILTLTAEPYLVAGVALAAILVQGILDWRKLSKPPKPTV